MKSNKNLKKIFVMFFIILFSLALPLNVLSWGNSGGDNEAGAGEGGLDADAGDGLENNEDDYYYTQDECTYGEIETQSCGLGGTQIRTCNILSMDTSFSLYWEWSSWDSCTGEGECNSGDTESRSCGTDTGACVSGTQSRTCTDWEWGSWGSCGGTYLAATTEVCDGIDNDCDGSTDEDVKNTYYQDSDGDAYGDTSVTSEACTVPSGYVSDATDCDDSDASVNSDATEVCGDGIDNDCSGGDLSCDDYDDDGDGYTENEGDCDDSDAGISPDATEVCDGIDNNCDSSIDEGVLITYYYDFDGDAYGDASVTSEACTAPTDYVSDSTDCDDNDNSINPGATEVCDGIDNDCDTDIDEDRACNVAPVANDVTATTDEDTAVDVNLDCTDADGDSLTYAVVSNPSNGVLSGSGSTITYTPNADYNGADTFTYNCNDGLLDSNTATASITINAVNDAPVANDVTATTDEDTAVDVNLDCTDVDGDSLTYAVVSDPSNGVLSGSGSTITYTPNADYNGADTFTYNCNDGLLDSNTATASITINAVSDAPVVQITHPDATHNNFVENFDVDLTASVTDPDGDSMTYTLDWGDGSTNSGSVSNDVVDTSYVYTSAGNYRINLTASDGSLTGSDFVDIVVWAYDFNITSLDSYNNSDYTNQDSEFYRNEPLYIKFEVIQKDSGMLVADNMNNVYLYNENNPSSVYDLTAYNGDADGVTIVNGQPSTPDGSYYYYMPNLPITDDILGWNVVFVFSYDGTNAGQEELQIQILNNPLVLSDLPNVNLDGNNVDSSIDLDDYVYDIETPDDEITWSYTTPGSNVSVSVDANNVVTFSVPAGGWVGTETITFTADDNDGSTASDDVIVSSEVPAVSVLTPNGGESLYQSYDITWSATDYQGDSLTISLEYSSDGINWVEIATNEANDGSYTWDISSIEQGNYIVRVNAFDGVYTGSDVSDGYFSILDSAPSSVDVEIISDVSSGMVPLTVTFSAQVSGNAPFSYEWDLDGDGNIDSTDATVVATYNVVGTYEVTLTVTDFDGDVGSDTATIKAEEQAVKSPRKKIHISKINIINDVLSAGEDLTMYVNFENQGHYKIKGDSSVTVIVPDLGLRKKISNIELRPGSETTKKFVLETPADARPGFYDVMVIIYDNGLKRVRYRPIRIIE